MDWGTAADWAQAGAAVEANRIAWLAWWGGLAQACFGLATAGIAVWAATTWRAALKHDRSDTCLAAAIDFDSAIGRLRDIFRITQSTTIDEGRGGAQFGRVVTDAYSSLRAFQKSYAIARRYYDTLDPTVPAMALAQLRDFTDNAFNAIPLMGIRYGEVGEIERERKKVIAKGESFQNWMTAEVDKLTNVFD